MTLMILNLRIPRKPNGGTPLTLLTQKKAELKSICDGKYFEWPCSLLAPISFLTSILYSSLPLPSFHSVLSHQDSFQSFPTNSAPTLVMVQNSLTFLELIYDRDMYCQNAREN